MKNNTNNIQELFTTYPDILSVSQLMELLQIGKVLAYKLIVNKKLKPLKLGVNTKLLNKALLITLTEGVKIDRKNSH